ncbi:D-alanine/D-serine/glycine permease [Streptomyces scabiei]|uniref:D-alanine/D-serine/glycine permease n=2 Tax=Streptomyces scabiei TaxID=1930 RepID=A0A100JR83_STRSC|nr:D-alanine/D-serine/glycine permease [Streptomyces scabiei]
MRVVVPRCTLRPIGTPPPESRQRLHALDTIHQRCIRPREVNCPYAKALCWSTLAFLAALTVLLAFDEGQRIALYALPVWAAVLIGGYRMSSRNAARKEHVPARAPSAR